MTFVTFAFAIRQMLQIRNFQAVLLPVSVAFGPERISCHRLCNWLGSNSSWSAKAI